MYNNWGTLGSREQGAGSREQGAGSKEHQRKQGARSRTLCGLHCLLNKHLNDSYLQTSQGRPLRARQPVFSPPIWCRVQNLTLLWCRGRSRGYYPAISCTLHRPGANLQLLVLPPASCSPPEWASITPSRSALLEPLNFTPSSFLSRIHCDQPWSRVWARFHQNHCTPGTITLPWKLWKTLALW